MGQLVHSAATHFADSIERHRHRSPDAGEQQTRAWLRDQTRVSGAQRGRRKSAPSIRSSPSRATRPAFQAGILRNLAFSVDRSRLHDTNQRSRGRHRPSWPRSTEGCDPPARSWLRQIGEQPEGLQAIVLAPARHRRAAQPSPPVRGGRAQYPGSSGAEGQGGFHRQGAQGLQPAGQGKPSPSPPHLHDEAPSGSTSGPTRPSPRAVPGSMPRSACDLARRLQLNRIDPGSALLGELPLRPAASDFGRVHGVLARSIPARPSSAWT